MEVKLESAKATDILVYLKETEVEYNVDSGVPREIAS